MRDLQRRRSRRLSEPKYWRSGSCRRPDTGHDLHARRQLARQKLRPAGAERPIFIGIRYKIHDDIVRRNSAAHGKSLNQQAIEVFFHLAASRAAGDLKQEHTVRPDKSQTGVFHDHARPLVLVYDLVAIMLRHLEGLEQDLMGHIENLPDFRFRTALDKVKT